MSEVRKFSNLDIGTVFRWGIDCFVKVSNEWNCELKKSQQLPNAVNCRTIHYAVFHPGTKVLKLKSRTDEKYQVHRT